MAPLALLTCMKPRIEKEHHYGSFIPEKALDLWGILCQQGLPGNIGNIKFNRGRKYK